MSNHSQFREMNKQAFHKDILEIYDVEALVDQITTKLKNDVQ